MERLLMMDHDEAVRLKATERYLLEEFDAKQREEFEEHLFDCQECAMDLRASAMFIEQSKVVLSETLALAPKPKPSKSSVGWFIWLRPAIAVPMLAVLVAVIGYQNFIQIPHQQQAANQMQALPYTSFKISTRSGPVQQAIGQTGKDMILFTTIAPDKRYPSYILELYNPTGRLQWLKIATTPSDDLFPIRIPGAGLIPGTYKLEVSGVNAAGQSTKLDGSTIELQIQK